MMSRLVSLKKVYELHLLIRKKTTGTHEEIAKKLGISRNGLFKLIAYLTDHCRAPIVYDQKNKTLKYEFNTRFYLSPEIIYILYDEPDSTCKDADICYEDKDEDWQDDSLASEADDVSGGSNDKGWYDNSDDDYSDGVILDDRINFNDLDFSDY